MLTPSVFGKDFFDDLFEFPFYDDRDMQKLEKKLYGRRGKNLMKTDIKDTDKAYELEMDLPGFKKDEIKVSLENGYLTISAARGLDVDEQEKETAKYIRKVDTTVSHTVDQMQDICKWCCQACFTFSFIDTLYMRFSHLQIQIHDLIFPFYQLLDLH